MSTNYPAIAKSAATYTNALFKIIRVVFLIYLTLKPSAFNKAAPGEHSPKLMASTKPVLFTSLYTYLNPKLSLIHVPPCIGRPMALPVITAIATLATTTVTAKPPYAL
jgi:hypothetical protein